MQTQEQNQDNPPVLVPKTSFACEFRSTWRQLPDKPIFLALLAAWLLLFHFLGNATLGYINTPSLLNWMYTSYTLKSPVADDGHGLLIPFVVLGLLWWKRKELLGLPLRVWWPGLLLVAAALAVHLIGYAIQQPRVSIIALFTGIYALVGLVWGPAFLRASFFPFFLFAFMVPLGSLTEAVTFPLRLLVTKIVAFLCQHLLAISVVSEGTRLVKMPWQYEYEVAAACSGIRSLIAISAMAIICAFVMFKGFWKRTVMITSALPLAVVGNTFRMMVVVIAAELGGQEAGARAHDSTFWSLLPYVPAIGGLLLLANWLERVKPGASRSGEGRSEPSQRA